MILLENIEETYPSGHGKHYSTLGVSASIERSQITESGWGSALSLPLEDTIKYAELRGNNCFIPSAGLLLTLYIELSKGGPIGENEQKFIMELDTYWHRTATKISFPVDGKKGSIEHIYPGTVEDLCMEEVPAFGAIARPEAYPDFFNKLFGRTDFEKSPPIALWIPQEYCIRNSPERLVIFGGFMQYGMAAWLTSYTEDKALVGTRPFRLIYDLTKK